MQIIKKIQYYVATLHLHYTTCKHVLHATNTAKINDFQDDIVVKHLFR